MEDEAAVLIELTVFSDCTLLIGVEGVVISVLLSVRPRDGEGRTFLAWRYFERVQEIEIEKALFGDLIHNRHPLYKFDTVSLPLYNVCHKFQAIWFHVCLS